MEIKKVFITGATGYIGGSIASHLVQNKYAVTGLARKPEDGERLKAIGINPVIGNIEQVKLITEESRKADAVINTADADDAFVVATLIAALQGTGKTLIHTSGSSIVAGRDNGAKRDFIYQEDVPIPAALEKRARIGINEELLAAATKNIRTIVIVPTMIYGKGMGLKKYSAQVPMLTELAKEKKQAMHIGKGENIWSNVHIEDLAHLYLLALEKAMPGSLFYAEHGEAALKDIAQAIQTSLGYSGKPGELEPDEAIARWGGEGALFGLGSNSRVTAQKAKTLLGWQPRYTDILQDIALKY